MNARPLVIITTRLPPEVCGIGTYSWLLHQYWPARDRPVQFLVMDAAGSADRTESVVDFHGRPNELAQALQTAGSADVLLHYAGRAFQRYGIPFGMPRVLKRWKRAHRDARLLVFFHELPADLPLTTPRGLLELASQQDVRQLGAVADVLVTNTAHHAEKLRRWTGRTDVHLIPVSSNIPAPTQRDAAARVATEFIIFGLPFGRLQTVQFFNHEIVEWHRFGLLTKLHLVGPEDGKFSGEADALLGESADLIVRHGLQPPAEVSRLLATAGFALSNATAETWSKSTSFMAYAAHGCPIVCKLSAIPSEPPLSYTIAPGEVGASGVAAKAARLQDWYEANASWETIAQRQAALLHA